MLQLVMDEDSHTLTSEQAALLSDKCAKLRFDSFAGDEYQVDRRLDRKLSRVTSVSIRADDNTPELFVFSVSIFPSLVELRLDGCPPSTVFNMYALRVQLKRLIFVNSGIFDVRDIFSPTADYCSDASFLSRLPPMILPTTNSDETAQTDADEATAQEYSWLQLSSVSLSNCGVHSMDESFHLMPGLQHLDLSHNSIGHIKHLQQCSYLQSVDLSHNRIEVLADVDRTIGSIIKLDLSHNHVEVLAGIDRLFALQRLSLAHNRVCDWRQVDLLTNLPNLASVALDGNPVATAPVLPGASTYRVKLFERFLRDPSKSSLSSRTLGGTNSMLPVLDGMAPSAGEIEQLRSSYFTPAEGEVPRRYSKRLSDENNESDLYTSELRAAAEAHLEAWEAESQAQLLADTSPDAGQLQKSGSGSDRTGSQHSAPSSASATSTQTRRTPAPRSGASSRAPGSHSSSSTTGSLLWSPRYSAAPQRVPEVFTSRRDLDVAMAQPSSREVAAMLSALDVRWHQKKQNTTTATTPAAALGGEGDRRGNKSLQQDLLMEMNADGLGAGDRDGETESETDSGADGEGREAVAGPSSWADWVPRANLVGCNGDGDAGGGEDSTVEGSRDSQGGYDRWDDSLQSLDSLQDERFLRELREELERGTHGSVDRDSMEHGLSGSGTGARVRGVGGGSGGGGRQHSEVSNSSDEGSFPRIEVDSPVQMMRDSRISVDSVGSSGHALRLLETLQEDDGDDDGDLTTGETAGALSPAKDRAAAAADSTDSGDGDGGVGVPSSPSGTAGQAQAQAQAQVQVQVQTQAQAQVQAQAQAQVQKNPTITDGDPTDSGGTSAASSPHQGTGGGLLISAAAAAVGAASIAPDASPHINTPVSPRKPPATVTGEGVSTAGGSMGPEQPPSDASSLRMAAATTGASSAAEASQSPSKEFIRDGRKGLFSFPTWGGKCGDVPPGTSSSPPRHDVPFHATSVEAFDKQYRGPDKYADVLVSNNLELYLKEQVFRRAVVTSSRHSKNKTAAGTSRAGKSSDFNDLTSSMLSTSPTWGVDGVGGDLDGGDGPSRQSMVGEMDGDGPSRPSIGGPAGAGMDNGGLGVPLPYLVYPSGQPAGSVERRDGDSSVHQHWALLNRSHGRRETYVSHFLTRRITLDDREVHREDAPTPTKSQSPRASSSAFRHTDGGGGDDTATFSGARQHSSPARDRAGVAASPQTAASPMLGPGAVGDNHGTYAPANEEDVLLVVTDIHLYVLSTSFLSTWASASASAAGTPKGSPARGSALPAGGKKTLEPTAFRDAPIPVLLARHSLRALSRVAIYFGYQRLRLDFSTVVASGGESDGLRESLVGADRDDFLISSSPPAAAAMAGLQQHMGVAAGSGFNNDFCVDSISSSGALLPVLEDWLRQYFLLNPASSTTTAAMGKSQSPGSASSSPLTIDETSPRWQDLRVRSHMLVCRDKSLCNSVLMSILKAANSRRRDIQPALMTVRISNTDSQLLDAVQASLRAVEGSGSNSRSQTQDPGESKIYFQMLHQVHVCFTCTLTHTHTHNHSHIHTHIHTYIHRRGATPRGCVSRGQYSSMVTCCCCVKSDSTVAMCD